MAIDALFTRSAPIVPVRGVHLDLKGCPPTFERLLSLLKLLAAVRYNAVLVEWEDMFPWSVDRRFQCETAYSPEEIARFHAEAKRLGIEVIPLVQCLGHLETPLNVSGYEHLREIPENADVLNPLAPGARELVQKMVEDVLNRSPGLRYFHLGGDEAWTFGTHPDTKAFIGKRGKGALYLQHVGPILDLLNARGIRPILWHDMMREWDSAALRDLAGRADLMVWGYGGHPDTTPHHYNSKIIQRFKEHGVPLWGGTAYKGADGHNVDLPNPQTRQENALAWAEVSQRFAMKGVITTAWSRYSTHRTQNEPIDAALDSLINQAVILHDGQPPRGGQEACVNALGEVGEKDRFTAARDAMRNLTNARQRGWTLVQHVHEQAVLATADPRRRSFTTAKFYEALKKHVDGLPAVEQQVKQALQGLMQELWINRYLIERLEPLREQAALLEARARQLTL